MAPQPFADLEDNHLVIGMETKRMASLWENQLDNGTVVGISDGRASFTTGLLGATVVPDYSSGQLTGKRLWMIEKRIQLLEHKLSLEATPDEIGHINDSYGY